jgi:Na+/melibiose symporter-like transporter
VALDRPVLVVYVLAALATFAGTLYVPAHSALLPSLCRTGQELTSANVVRGMLDSVATLAGPLLAAVLVEFAGVAVVFAVAAGASLAAAALLLRLGYDAPPRPPAPQGVHLRADVAEGVRVIVRNRDLALLNGLTIAQTFTRGALTVFVVVVALDLLRIGEPGVGTLTAAVGAGAVVGSLAASLLVGSRRLARWFGIGIALWGLPIAPLHLDGQIGTLCCSCPNIRPAGELGLAYGRARRCLCLTVDQSDKRACGDGGRRCALSDVGAGDVASPGTP